MLLPQSEAFHMLRKRLQCVPDFSFQTKRYFHLPPPNFLFSLSPLLLFYITFCSDNCFLINDDYFLKKKTKFKKEL